MELFRISTTNATREKMSVLYEDIKKELNELQPHQFTDKINLVIQPSQLYCMAIYPQFQLKRDSGPIYNKVSQGIAEFVLNEIEQQLIAKLIRLEYQEYDKYEISVIEQYCTDLINNDGAEQDQDQKDGRRSRKQKLAHAFENYLLEYTELNIEGFIQFRLPAYKDDLREVVEYAVDEFVMDKQYQEFISLLKYFVYVQDTKVPEVHIIHKEDNDFMILNEQLEPMENKKTESFVVEMIDKDINYEDMIISTLISISPQKVYIHTREKEMQVIKTIQQIFEDRTVICEDCHICHPVLSKYSVDR